MENGDVHVSFIPTACSVSWASGNKGAVVEAFEVWWFPSVGGIFSISASTLRSDIVAILSLHHSSTLCV